MPSGPASKPVQEMFDLSGRVAVVTGGAGNLGREYTRALLEAGALVVVADIRSEIAAEVADAAVAACGSEAFGVGVDVASKDDIGRMTTTVLEKWGRLDILINNAAIDPKFDSDSAAQQHYSFEDYPLDLWQRSMNVNLTGAFLCAQAAGRVMVQQGGGVMVNVCSTYGLVAPDQRLYRQEGEVAQTLFKPADYGVTKAGIAQLTRYLAVYWGDKNIRVNTLTPGGVRLAQDDGFVQRYEQRTPIGRMANLGEMSGALLFLVSDASSYMTGANLVVDGGWTAW
ncbi:MAG: putative oxidoreductase [Acidobacteria bacterium]|nr:putative oxidoreductase [Acidobacteriota bacterium]